MPTGLARLIIPAFGFTGAVKTQRPDYLPPDYKQVMLDTEGLEFHNPKDDARQVLKKQDGCLICYEKPGMKEKVDAYIAKHPDTFKTAANIQKFLKFLMPLTVNPETGKADVWDTDVAFAAGLVNAPAKDKIVPGTTFTGAKKKECVKAFYIPYGNEFQGPTGSPQKPTDKRGAFVLSDKEGGHLIQFDDFFKAYGTGKQVLKIEEKRDIETHWHYDETLTTERTLSDKHVLETRSLDGSADSAFFDGEPLEVQFKHLRFYQSAFDWVASYENIKKTNPEAAKFIQQFMFTPAQQKAFQKALAAKSEKSIAMPPRSKKVDAVCWP